MPGSYPISWYADTKVPKRCRKAVLDGRSCDSSINIPLMRPCCLRTPRSFSNISSSESFRLRQDDALGRVEQAGFDNAFKLAVSTNPFFLWVHYMFEFQFEGGAMI